MRRRSEPLPFKYFRINLTKYKVLKWGSTQKGQKHLLVQRVIDCTINPHPGIKYKSKLQEPFEIKYPLTTTHSEIAIIKAE